MQHSRTSTTSWAASQKPVLAACVPSWTSSGRASQSTPRSCVDLILQVFSEWSCALSSANCLHSHELCRVQEFYKVLEAASTKQQLTRAFVQHALQTLPHGFGATDTSLIFHASLVSDAYDKWYRVFAQAVRVCIFPATLQCSLVVAGPCPLL